MGKKILIIDFDDSFTYNIASEIKKLDEELEVQVLQYQKFLNKPQSFDHLVLGPGPGHPDDYRDFDPWIERIVSNSEFPVCGICLGHQLIWNYLGACVGASKQPRHGETIEIKIDSEWKKILAWNQKDELKVQLYNSLVVDWNSFDWGFKPEVRTLFSSQGELMATDWKHIRSYQFHPESIGTSFPSLFLSCILSSN
ncbi:MAG: aminodeoxychorismate/anthranilate synthase component II [Halobacteriovoraceae bacterium]|nr:aminodeoxychorismate/anthranilate synthase component II [Halobacteriovoraceae bacterium]